MDVKTSLENARNKIIDRIILASVLFGMLASLSIVWRDFDSGINSSNSVYNFSLVVILGILWMFRKGISVRYKYLGIFTVYLIVAVKAMQLMGPFSPGFVYLAFCSIMIVLSTSVRKSIIYTFVLSLTIPIIGIIFITGYVSTSDLNEEITRVSLWVAYYFNYILTCFILILGVGQMRGELVRNFILLSSTITDLKKTNEQLSEEIDIKNAYEEKLVLSNQKIKGLFDSTRDGILLIDSNKRVLEANPAILEMTGYTLPELQEIDVNELVMSENREQINENFMRLMNGEILKTLTEVSVINSNGSRTSMELNSNLLITDEGALIMTMVRDISIRKELENQKFNAALEAEERERERFSKDLHDDLGPVFSTLKLYLQTLSNSEKSNEKKEILNNLSEIVDGAVKQVREISHNMSPYLLRDHGLIEAIGVHVKKFEVAESIKVNYSSHITDSKRASSNVEIVIYRIFLELLNNTLKHSGANEININLEISEFKLEFDYIDNGKGFDFQSLDQAEVGIGLKNIINRLKALKGNIDFSYENKLMTTKISIPL